MNSLSKSSYVILGGLSKADYSGYALKKLMTKTSDFYWSESNAQIYPVLKKLEQQKLVSSKIDKTSGARNKRIYSITKKGLEELQKWLDINSGLGLYREEFLLQLSLGQHLSKTKLLKKITYYRDSIVEKLEKLDEILSHIKTHHAGKADQEYLLLTYEHIKCVLEAKLKWCDKTITSFK